MVLMRAPINHWDTPAFRVLDIERLARFGHGGLDRCALCRIPIQHQREVICGLDRQGMLA